MHQQLQEIPLFKKTPIYQEIKHTHTYTQLQIIINVKINVELINYLELNK